MQKEIITDTNTLYIGQSTNDSLSQILQTQFSDSKKIILTDDNVFEYWMEQLVTSVPELSDAEVIQVPEGEESKCLEIAVQVWETLSDHKVERGDVIINFGGGVITDLGGFVASVYKRGLCFINIPTSLLAQVDASVGGKTGIDLGPFKNQIGTFNDAHTVFVNPNYLSTLSKDELRSGYAEMLKHGLIASRNHWNDLKKVDYNQTEKLTGLIYDSIQIKNTIVSADPFEKNVRKALNFGHTVGHAIEGYLLQKTEPIKHGLAIAWGMVTESYIAYKAGLLGKDDWDEINYILTDFYKKPDISVIDFPHLLSLMENDKKNVGGKINFTLLSSIGTYIINQEVEKDDIEEALTFIFG